MSSKSYELVCNDLVNFITENLFCSGTYKKVLDLVARPALEGADIKFNTKVERISYRADPKDKAKVQVNGGQTLDFDEVVVTAPLGWLQRNLNAFEPALPVRMTKAIHSISYGCLEKVGLPSVYLIMVVVNIRQGLYHFPQGLLAWIWRGRAKGFGSRAVAITCLCYRL